jgi:HAE1 family hydrophobic/amphiphilic exporter-1
VLTLLSFGLGRGLGTELIPQLHQGRFTIEAALPVGTPIESTVKEVRRLDDVLSSHPEIAHVYTTVGADRRADTASDEGEHTARMRVTLRPGGDMAIREQQVMSSLRTRLARLSRMQLNLVRPALFSFKTPVEVVIYGYDLDRLSAASDKVLATMSEMDGLRDVKSSLGRGYPELRILYDRIRLNRHGLDTYGVATTVRDRIQGVEATRLQRGDKKVDVRLQLTESQRQTVADLSTLNVNPELMPPIPLAAVAELEEGYGPSEIRRVDQQRAVVVTANTTGFDLGSVSESLHRQLQQLSFPQGVLTEVAGQAKEMRASMRSLGFALLLAVFLVYVIMASSFESIVHPLVILLSVPLALVGVVLSLWAFGFALSAVVAIGAIVLSGVVVNNAIVLVDTINRLRAEGMDRDAAIASAASLRLRPILMTTMTTVLGLFPLAIGPMFLGWIPDSLGFSEGVEIQQPLALTVIGGLLSSTFLTLLIVPILYRLMTPRGRS